MIEVHDIALHILSGLYYRCENTKQKKWMNENPFYKLVPKNTVPDSYFFKSAAK